MIKEMAFNFNKRLDSLQHEVTSKFLLEISAIYQILLMFFLSLGFKIQNINMNVDIVKRQSESHEILKRINKNTKANSCPSSSAHSNVNIESGKVSELLPMTKPQFVKAEKILMEDEKECELLVIKSL